MSKERNHTEDYLLYLKITKDIFKFCVIGDGGVGKTTFINFLTTGELAPDFDVTRTPYINIDGCKLGGHTIQLYDLAGQRRVDAHPLDHMQNVVLKGTDVILFFFSLDNLESFISIKKWYEEVKLFYKNWENDRPLLFLIGNKLDLPRNVEAFNGEELVERMDDFESYNEMSLFSGEEVENFLKALCDKLDEQFKNLKETHGL